MRSAFQGAQRLSVLVGLILAGPSQVRPTHAQSGQQGPDASTEPASEPPEEPGAAESPPGESAAPGVSAGEPGPVGPAPASLPADGEASAVAPTANAPVDVAVESEAPEDEAEARRARTRARVVKVSARSRTRARKARRSANAVAVVDLEEAKQESADLGEVLARNTAVTVQRTGGLGSRGAFALGGLGDERLRFFLDGVPLELMGFVAGLQNVPVNLVDQIEVYQGVVPSRLGADALGGAVELVSSNNVARNHLGFAYEQGSFGTHRTSVSGRLLHKPTRIFARGSAFYDVSDNNYEMDVLVSNALGRASEARLPRFHSGYSAAGGEIAVGVVAKPWAKRLIVTAFASEYKTELQHAASSVDYPFKGTPYGEATFDRSTHGANLRYEVGHGSVGWSMVAGYARLDTKLRDETNCVYNWWGICTESPVYTGEIDKNANATDQSTDTLFLRGELALQVHEDHELRFSIAPTYADRRGANRFRITGNDPLSHPRRLFSGVVGAELESDFFAGRLKNIAFVKGYGFGNRSRALLDNGDWDDMSRDYYRAGGGDSLRFAFLEDVYLKASVEHAARFPSAVELFGNGGLIQDNLALRPESSNNVNLGIHVESFETPVGAWRLAVEGFARWSHALIQLTMADDQQQIYQNVLDARAVGMDAALGWTVPDGDWLALEGRLMVQDLRNVSDSGEFAEQKGQRIPNLPYSTASGKAQLRFHEFVVASDQLVLSWNTRYTGKFSLSYESFAQNAEKPTVDAQVSHSVAVTYSVYGLENGSKLHVTFEGLNITDAKLQDFFGIQRPGRAFFSKLTLDL